MLAKLTHILSLVLVFFVGASLMAKSAFAFDLPSFGSCPNPSGEIIANYDSGVHGIVGDSLTHTGSDKVYSESSVNLVQCYCPSAGDNGIQTKWLYASQMSTEDIQSLENSGWIYVENGSDWGLNEGPYLAFNSGFSCSNQGQSGGDILGSGASTSSDPGDPGNGTGGQVLGFAATGNLSKIAISSILAFIFLATFVIIRRGNHA